MPIENTLTSTQGFSCVVKRRLAAGNSTRVLKARAVTAAGQFLLEQMSDSNLPLSEDCLTLNVWTKPQVGESKKAVMVWIHGGGFTSGSSALPWYRGQNIADQQDVVVVSIK